MWSLFLLCSLAAGHPHHGLKHSGGKKVDAAATPEIECPTQQPTRDRSGAGHGSLRRSNASALSQFGKWLRCA